jgi:two-component system chemotaxis sensor kinase CheA
MTEDARPNTCDEEDAELLEEFLVESRDNLAQAEAALLALEGNPADSEAIGRVFRAFHTIKGVSGFLDLEDINTFAHAAESLLMPLRDGERAFSEQLATLALRSVDMVATLLDRVEAAGPGQPPARPPGLEALVEELEAAHHDTSGEAPTETTAIGAPGEAAAVDSPSDATAPRPAETSEQPKAARAEVVETFVRVRTDRLDKLLEAVGELVIANSMVFGDQALVATPELAPRVAHCAKIVRELRDLSLSLRMVPLRSTFRRVTRVVRDVALQQGKLVDLVVEGEETEIDRNTVDALADPLLHMVRNAVDHGIETPIERERRGKAGEGRLILRAANEQGAVVIQLSDDGAGLDRARILSKAIERGLVSPGASLSDEAVFALIFEPGFSTADRITAVSGRGVGMDVVRRGVEALGGRVQISSEAGRGTTFRITLPLTLAITDGMLVRVGAERFIVPIVSISQTFQPAGEDLMTVSGHGEAVILRDETLPLFRLHRLLGIHDAIEDPTRGLLVRIEDDRSPFALLVDELIGQQQVVTKPLGELVGDVAGIAGGAILGDGRIGLILDASSLSALARGESPRGRYA